MSATATARSIISIGFISHHSSSLPANGSRECAPDDRLREAIHLSTKASLDCFVASAPRHDGKAQLRDLAACFSRSPPSAKRWGGVGGGGCLSKFAARGTSRINPPPDPSPPRARARGGRGDQRARLRDLAACFRARFAFCVRLPLKRGRRECRALDAPAASRTIKNKVHERSHHEYTGTTRHSPRNGFNGFLRALPGDRAFLPPSPAGHALASLAPASGRQNHTTSPSARKRPRQKRFSRPPHPAPRP